MSSRISAADARALMARPSHITPQDPATKPRKRSKFGNVRVELDGITFDSAKEARRYQVLKLLERGGEIRNLRRQVKHPLTAGSPPVVVGHYQSDFDYEERVAGAWLEVTEDVKGGEATQTPVFKLKAKIFEAIYGRPVKIT